MSSWFKKPVNLAITIGAAVLAVVVVSLIIYGVTTHREPGLLQVCWQPNDSAAYANPGDLEGLEAPDAPCAEPEELRWDRKQVPLKVAWQALQDSDERALKAAIQDINAQLGFKMLVETPEGEASDIVVELEAHLVGEKNPPAGWAHHVRSNGVVGCDAKIRSLAASERFVYLVAHHELLHCIGLAHDQDNPASAIYPLTSDDTLEDTMKAVRITDFDRALIRRLYHD